MTKCNNCRFRAKVNGKEKTGCIQVIDGCIKFWFDHHNELNDIIHHTVHLEYYRLHGSGDVFDDFEIVPRDPETYRDWQVGDSLLNEDISSSGELPSGRVIFRAGELVVIADWRGHAMPYTCDELYDEGYRLVLTDIENQIIEERKKYEPQDGDICYAELISDWVFIKKDGEFLTENYAALKLNDGYTNFDNPSRINNDAFVKMIRIATEGEKQKLFDAMAKQGKRWNAEKKVVEDIPKPYEFKKGEPVLVRDYDDNIWKLAAFRLRSGNIRYPYEVRNERGNYYCYRKCIPYNEKTMHLLGTAEDYKEEQL